MPRTAGEPGMVDPSRVNSDKCNHAACRRMLLAMFHEILLVQMTRAQIGSRVSCFKDQLRLGFAAALLDERRTMMRYFPQYSGDTTAP